MDKQRAVARIITEAYIEAGGDFKTIMKILDERTKSGKQHKSGLKGKRGFESRGRISQAVERINAKDPGRNETIYSRSPRADWHTRLLHIHNLKY